MVIILLNSVVDFYKPILNVTTLLSFLTIFLFLIYLHIDSIICYLLFFYVDAHIFYLSIDYGTFSMSIVINSANLFFSLLQSYTSDVFLSPHISQK